jgi:hypothetical protein
MRFASHIAKDRKIREIRGKIMALRQNYRVTRLKQSPPLFHRILD